ncbi:MAG: hypothetical protein K0S12_1963, partial [Bacteroidetes bacterium]|nr:hypothetical protein [Bacteroidota bacterium]
MKSGSFFQILTLFVTAFSSAQNQAGDWKYIGPGEMNVQVKGFFKSVWADETNLNLVLAGSCSGGLFKTENAMADKPRWKNITDTYTGLSFGVSDIVVRPGTNNKTIYIATGHNSGLIRGYGNGILKTSNGGESWEEVGPAAKDKNLFYLEGLVANKENPDQMIAYSPSEVFFTKDDWKTFEQIALPLKKDNKDVSISDVEFAPFEQGKFYVCTRTNNHYASKLFVCEEDGKKVKDITPSDVKSERIELATLMNPRFKGRFYIALGTSDCYVKYFDGNKFHSLNEKPVNHVFSGTYWNLELCVNQVDTTIMYLSMTETSRSTDGGKTFTKIGTYNGQNTHADVRGMILGRSSAGGKDDALFLANDGGISFIEKYQPLSWKNLNGSGLDANQVWGADVAQSDSLFVAGGAQDNGGFLITDKETMNTMNSCGDGYLGLILNEHSALIECNTPSLFFHNIQTKGGAYIHINDPHAGARRPLQSVDSFVYVGHHDVWRARKSDLLKNATTFENFSRLPFNKRENGSYRNHYIKSMCIGKS